MHGYARNDIMDRSWTAHVDGLMQPLHSRSHAVILALEIHIEGQVILAVPGHLTDGLIGLLVIAPRFPVHLTIIG